MINCAGPYAAAVNAKLRLRGRSAAEGAGGDTGAIPLCNEVHAKAVLKDSRGVVPAEAPMAIWQDEIELEWSEEEAAELRAMGGFEASLTRPLAAGKSHSKSHTRPCFPYATPVFLFACVTRHFLYRGSPPAVPGLPNLLVDALGSSS